MRFDRANFPNPYLWEEVATQAPKKALVWAPRRKFQNTSEYESAKVGKCVEKPLAAGNEKGDDIRNSARTLPTYNGTT